VSRKKNYLSYFIKQNTALIKIFREKNGELVFHFAWKSFRIFVKFFAFSTPLNDPARSTTCENLNKVKEKA
jgi:hypothetical protein